MHIISDYWHCTEGHISNTLAESNQMHLYTAVFVVDYYCAIKQSGMVAWHVTDFSAVPETARLLLYILITIETETTALLSKNCHDRISRKLKLTSSLYLHSVAIVSYVRL